MGAVGAVSSFATGFSATGNYATIIACNPLPLGTGSQILNGAIFSTVGGIIYSAGSLTGGSVFIQLLQANGVWVSTTTATLTISTAPFIFNLQVINSISANIAYGPIYGARFNVGTTLTGSTIAYAELTGILAQA